MLLVNRILLRYSVDFLLLIAACRLLSGPSGLASLLVSISMGGDGGERRGVLTRPR